MQDHRYGPMWVHRSCLIQKAVAGLQHVRPRSFSPQKSQNIQAVRQSLGIVLCDACWVTPSERLEIKRLVKLQEYLL